MEKKLLEEIKKLTESHIGPELKREIQDRCHRVWAYARENSNNLNSDFHARMIYELVTLPLPSLASTIAALQAKVERLENKTKQKTG